VDRRIKSLFGHVGCNLWLDSEHGYVEIQSWLLSQQPALLLTANHVKEQKFYLGKNLHVLCIPIQNQESTQSNMIYSSGLRSIIDLKEGRKTTWCTISFSSNLHDLSNLRSIDNSHMSIPQSSPYSVLVVVLVILLRVSIVIDSDSSVDGVWLGRCICQRTVQLNADRSYSLHEQNRTIQRSRNWNTKFYNYVLYTVQAAPAPCAPAGPHRRLDRCKIAVRRDRPVARLQRPVIMPCFSRADCDTPE